MLVKLLVNINLLHFMHIKKIDIDIALILILCLPFRVVGGYFKFKMNKDAD